VLVETRGARVSEPRSPWQHWRLDNKSTSSAGSSPGQTCSFAARPRLRHPELTPGAPPGRLELPAVSVGLFASTISSQVAFGVLPSRSPACGRRASSTRPDTHLCRGEQGFLARCSRFGSLALRLSVFSRPGLHCRHPQSHTPWATARYPTVGGRDRRAHAPTAQSFWFYAAYVERTTR